jgi:hypothetical protein
MRAVGLIQRSVREGEPGNSSVIYGSVGFPLGERDAMNPLTRPTKPRQATSRRHISPTRRVCVIPANSAYHLVPMRV